MVVDSFSTCRSFVLVLLVAAALAPRARAIPSEPATIRHLATHADWIGVVDVAAVVSADAQGVSRASVRVVERIAGGDHAELTVAFDTRTHCPAPVRFEPGARVVVFLSKARDGGRWPTEGRSSVRAIPDASARTAFLDRIRDALALPVDAGPRALAVHALRCIEHPATAWDGAFDLAFHDEIRAALTPEERQQLRSNWLPLPSEVANPTLVDDEDGVTLVLEDEPDVEGAAEARAKIPSYTRLEPWRLTLILVGVALGEVDLPGKVASHLRLLASDGP